MLVRVNALHAHTDKKTYKIMNVLGKDMTAIIDPGSDLHIMQSSFYVQLGASKIRQEIVTFNGVSSVK